MANEGIEGNTLVVYAYVAHADKPVGTRDVTRGADLSSPSVAHRQLLKLEGMGLIEKNAYGDYILKEKANINGHVWVGKNLVPRLMFYSLFFMGAFAAEVSILLFSLVIKGLVIETSFFFLTGMTCVAMLLFFVEGTSLFKKVKPRNGEV